MPPLPHTSQGFKRTILKTSEDSYKGYTVDVVAFMNEELLPFVRRS